MERLLTCLQWEQSWLNCTHCDHSSQVCELGCAVVTLISSATFDNIRRHNAGSSEADQIYKICSVMGTPTKAVYADGLKLAANMNFRFPAFSPQPLAKLIPTASPEAIELIAGLCHWYDVELEYP